MCFNNFLTIACYILSVKVLTKFSKKDFLILIKVCVHVFYLLLRMYQSQLIFVTLTLKSFVISDYNKLFQ